MNKTKEFSDSVMKNNLLLHNIVASINIYMI